MKVLRFFAFVLLFVIVFSTLSCADNNGETETTVANETTLPASDNQTTPPPAETTLPEAETTAEPSITTAPVPQQNLRILFIGNSYTYYNDMPQVMFKQAAKSAGINVTVVAITKGSYTLESFINPNDTYGQQVEAVLKSQKFDYVIIQEQSLRPVISPDYFYTAVRDFYNRVKDTGAQLMLYETWGSKKGHSALAENKLTNETMTWKLAAAYSAIGEELGIDVNYAGLGIYDMYTNHPETDMYNADLKHPSPAGSYLIALTFLAKIYGISPVGLEYNASIADAEAVKNIQQAAHDAVFNTPAIPTEYKTSSVGIAAQKVTGYGIDYTKSVNLTSFPTTPIISVLKGGTYPNGKTFSGILGAKNQIASKEYSTTGLSEAQKADIADIGYGVSVIGIEKMDSSAKGYTTAVENLVNGHWGSSFMANWVFDDNKYDISGSVAEKGKYTGLITLNFGEKMTFDALGWFSGSLKGFPGAAEVFVSDDGKNWTIVPTACWDQITGTTLVSVGASGADPWAGNSATVSCIFDMNDISGQYVRIGVAVGRNDDVNKYNSINTRELVVYGTKFGA